MAHASPSPSPNNNYNIDYPPLPEPNDKDTRKDDAMKVAVIGAGPSGLVTLKYLAMAHHYFPIEPLELICVEAEKDLGGTFKYRVYEDAELVSSKYLTAFSDHRFPRDLPDFVTPEDMCDYLYSYAAKYDLFQHICFDTSVISVKRRNRGHALILENGMGVQREIWCDAIAVCSGLHVIPEMPYLNGLEYAGEVLHSSELKSREQFGVDKNVIILGAGETAMDLAWLAVTSPTKSVTVCHRDGFFCGPKIIPTPVILNGFISNPEPGQRNKPTDCAVASLFDTAYVPDVLQKSQLLWGYYDKWIKFSQWMISGTPNGPDQWAGIIPDKRRHVDSVFFCKSARALPYMSAMYRPKSWWYKFRKFFINVPIQETHGSVIDVRNWPKLIDSEGTMHFGRDPIGEGDIYNGIKADVVVFATGYRREVRFLDQSYHQPPAVSERCIYEPGDISVAYIGFVRPSFGAIPPLAEMQAQLWVYRLLQAKYPRLMPPHPTGDWSPHANALPPYELDWALHCRDGEHNFSFTKGGVDHEAYAYQLALDLGAAPTFRHVLGKGFKVFYTWAMGSNFNTKFRLVGPWKEEEEAERIMRTELYDVVKETGGIVFFTTYTLIPMAVFGFLSLSIHAFNGACGRLGRGGRAFRELVCAPLTRSPEELHND